MCTNVYSTVDGPVMILRMLLTLQMLILTADIKETFKLRSILLLSGYVSITI